MASVKVAVRVRPFNKREESLESGLVVQVRGNQVCLNPIASGGMVTSTPTSIRERGRPHKFTFDYAHWSHDRLDDHYADQARVFRDLGTSVVDNAFNGYNVCVFAYGQTGSGKTYTMMGDASPAAAAAPEVDECEDRSDRGLIPRICSSLFRKMEEAGKKGTYRTEVSYLEIYNESVRDLLNANASGTKLKLREHPKNGPYVENLTKHLVVNYRDILSLMERGNKVRTTASTNMNDTSSRSHAIFTIVFVNAGFTDGLPHETVSKIHLVDLAGSERADSTGASGQRLKEGAHINKSLVTLGSVISALSDASATTAKKVFIPYRDSALTWLLKDSLGGNSKTFMIATVSPAEVNHGEILSTLRYANRAKSIINKPTVNEDPNVKLIRELRDEIDRLRRMMSTDPSCRSKLALKEAQERHLTEEWTEKWKEAAKILKEQSALALKRTGWGVLLDSDKPHLVGIDEDVLSTGIALYHLKTGDTRIGAHPSSDIVLKGPNVMEHHCVIGLEEEEGVTLTPNPGALCIVNAATCSSPVKLSQGCVMIFGKTNMFRYNDPKEAASMRLNMSSSGSSSNNDKAPLPLPPDRGLLSQSLSDLRAEHSLNDDDDDVNNVTAIANNNNDKPSNVSPEASCEEEELEKEALRSTPESRTTSDSMTASQVEEEEEESMAKLYDRINDQKEIVMTCLETESCDVVALERQISLLQSMQNAYSRMEFERARNAWLRSVDPDGGYDADDHHHQDHFTRLVEREVDKRLLLRSEADFRQREMLRIEKDRELTQIRRQHEREIYLLRKKLHESTTTATPSNDLRPFDVTVAIPNYALSGSGSSQHVEFSVHVGTGGGDCPQRWQVQRRFRQFRFLHVHLSRVYGSIVQSIPFPSRKLFGNTSAHLAQERRLLLQRYLNTLIQSCSEIKRCPLYKKPTKDAVVGFSSFFKED